MMPDLTLNQKLDIVLDKLSGAAKRVYDYEHEAFVVKNLTTVYNDIIADNSEFENISAIGFTALLKNGDVIEKIGRMFINGKEELEDYTFSGMNSDNGNEIVNVWYFESNGQLSLANPIDLDIAELQILNKNASPSINNSYYDFADKIKAENFSLPTTPKANRRYKDIYSDIGKSTFNVSPLLEEYESTATMIPRNFKGFQNNANIKKLSFPNLIRLGNNTDSETIWSDGSNVCFYNCSNPNLIACFPVLKYIYGGSSNVVATNVMFAYWEKVEIPETVELIYNAICRNNKKIILNCKDIRSIHNDWCSGTPSELFSMCADWGASINIATAAANWQKADFIDLFTNKLRDMTLVDETRTLKIPTAIYNALSAEEIAIATTKGWTITHP